MKVKELIEKLKGLDQNLNVLCYTEDEALIPQGYGFRLLDIESIDVVEGEKVRGDNQIPSLKLGKTEYSENHVIINVTADF